jgi:hypothetical protein
MAHMDAKRGQSLAARLRAGIEDRAEARARESAERAEQKVRLMAERSRLFDDLVAFGNAVGHLTVSRTKTSLVIAYGGSKLRFEYSGQGDRVKVSGGDLPKGIELALQAELQRWVVISPSLPGRTDQELLFDTGLGHLMEAALGLTTPAE